MHADMYPSDEYESAGALFPTTRSRRRLGRGWADDIRHRAVRNLVDDMPALAIVGKLIFLFCVLAYRQHMKVGREAISNSSRTLPRLAAQANEKGRVPLVGARLFSFAEAASGLALDGLHLSGRAK